MEKEKLQPQHRDVIASDTDTCMMQHVYVKPETYT